MLLAVGDHAGKIQTAYLRGTTAIFDTSDACCEAEVSLSFDDQNLLMKNLPFSKPTFSKYLTIGRCERLKDPAVRDRLPPKFSVIYEIARLDDETYGALKDRGMLRPSLRREDLQKWQAAHSNERSRRATIAKTADEFAYTAAKVRWISIEPTAVPANDVENFLTDIEPILSRYGLRVLVSDRGPSTLVLEAA